MSPRPYRLGVRADAVDETRQRVVAAARERLSESGYHGTSVDDVARRADVARATVYHQFGSKVGLLEAVIEDFERRAGLAELARLIEEAPAHRLLGRVVAAGCRYWATDPVLCRKIINLGAADPEVSALLERHDAGRERLLARMLDRLADAGELRPGCSRAEAADVLWLVTSFDAFDLLTRGGRRTPAVAARRLIGLAERQIAPADAGRGTLRA
jgi:AcrR family transcriptional regulator